MQNTEHRWGFSVAVLLPVIAALLITVVLAAGFIVWSAQRIDRTSLDRQQAVVAHFVQGAKSDFEGTQGAVVLRYETVDAFLDGEPDLDWIDAELGMAEYLDFSHDRVYVLDPDLRPIYAARAGESHDLSVYDHDRAVIDPIVVDSSPKGMFDDAAIKAVSRWRYNPKIEGAVAVQRVGVQTIIRFNLEDN